MNPLIVVIALVGFAACKLSCPMYYEVPSFDDPNECAYRTFDYVQLKPCANKTLSCSLPFSIEEESRCAPPPTAEKLPGEYCESATECMSGKCEVSQCRGSKANVACYVDTDCDAGLYCYARSCRPLVKVGEDCSKDKKCEVTSFCMDSTTCVQYASLENGRPSLLASGCKSFYSEGGICVAGPKRLGTAECPEETETCSYNSSSGMIISQMCSCGMTKNTSALCPLGRGDINLSDVFFFHLGSSLL